MDTPIPTPPSNDHFLYLVDNSLDVDLRQEMFLALLREHPLTELEATAIITRIGFIDQYTRRQEKRRSMPLLAEPCSGCHDLQEPGVMVASLDTLPAEDQELISAHVVEGHSLRTIAVMEGVSKDTIRKRYNLAKAKLISVVKKR